jgi:hypothetical protein
MAMVWAIIPPIDAPTTMRGARAQVVEQADRVVGHVLQRVARRQLARDELAGGRGRDVAQDGRAPVVPVVEPDDPQAAGGEALAELLAPGEHLGAEPHDEERHGVLVVPELLVAELDVPDGAALLGHPAQGRRRARGAAPARRARPDTAAVTAKHEMSGR